MTHEILSQRRVILINSKGILEMKMVVSNIYRPARLQPVEMLVSETNSPITADQLFG
jgi:hypothetical protein